MTGAGGGGKVEAFAAVSIKEMEQSPHGPKLVQKKKTFYPDWGKCFDSHLVSGRRMMVRREGEIKFEDAANVLVLIYCPFPFSFLSTPPPLTHTCSLFLILG